ncbi:LuxR family transcriptional regulator, partial [Methylobacterium frigidaeris]
MVDSHCHLDSPGLAERLPEVLARARSAGIDRMVTISTRVRRFETYRRLSEAHPE